MGYTYFVYIGPTCLKGVDHHDKCMSIPEKKYFMSMQWRIQGGFLVAWKPPPPGHDFF